jgi:hypothetical protein
MITCQIWITFFLIHPVYPLYIIDNGLGSLRHGFEGWEIIKQAHAHSQGKQFNFH